MVYLRTIVSAQNEIKYIKMQLTESTGYVDKIVVCEFNRTHTGKKRTFIFEEYLSNGTFTPDELERIIYIKGDVNKEISEETSDSVVMHKNEKLFRGYFAHHMEIQPNDILICVDADEIIFHRAYPNLLKNFKWKWLNPVIRLRMYQFFYKPTYLWENLIFSSAVICRYKKHQNEYPAQWRDEGKESKKIVGCHFSWCLSVDEMITKLQSYAHSADYLALADRAVLEQAIKEKTYPFDPEREFNIREVNHKDMPQYYPDFYKEEYFLM